MGLLDNKIVTGLQLHVKFIQSDTNNVNDLNRVQ